ncbi:uncharacterized protein [Argopecten irradians]|uniref:uncharacterized protein isoform X2 n=1 Tax=Argopecten irradians TaxID=31199 RepID=UPI003710C46C
MPYTRSTRGTGRPRTRSTAGTETNLRWATKATGIPLTRATKDKEIKRRRASKISRKPPTRDTKSTEMSIRQVTKGTRKPHTHNKMSTAMNLRQSTKGTAKTNTHDAKGTEMITGDAHTSACGDTEKVPSRDALASGMTPVLDANDTGKALIQNDDRETDVEHNIPLDYELNLTLVEIDQELTPENLKHMKYCYSGEEGFGRRVQDKIETGLDFFEHMKMSMRLDRNNLLYLQTLLWKIDHTGRSPVTFHLSGEAVDRRHVHRLQGLVARLLIIPEETIFVNEVKVFHSIVITFLIPDSALSILKDLTSEEKGLLKQCDVDCVFIGKIKISFTGKYKTPVKLKERCEILKLLQRNKQLERRIEYLQIALLEKKKKQEKNKRKINGRVRKGLDDPNEMSPSQSKSQKKKQEKKHSLQLEIESKIKQLTGTRKMDLGSHKDTEINSLLSSLKMNLMKYMGR